MKNIIFFVSLAILISLPGCNQATEPAASDIYVNFEIESAFQNDSVKVTLDEKILLESRVTTDYSVSLAWASGIQRLSRDCHILHFEVVEYGTQKDYGIDITNDTSSVLIRFDQISKQISIQQIKGRYLRD
jgi:hypothetical protein